MLRYRVVKLDCGTSDPAGLLRKKPIAKSHPRKLKQSVVDQIIYLRKTYHLGSKRMPLILLIMKKVNSHSGYIPLEQIGDMNFKLSFIGMWKIRVWDISISSHVHHNINGKVERSHHIDQEEFYQLLTYTDNVDLNKKLETWEQFYNFDRPHGAFEGETPYETLRSLLTKRWFCPAGSDVLHSTGAIIYWWFSYEVCWCIWSVLDKDSVRDLSFNRKKWWIFVWNRSSKSST